jgi:hypothetical protein
MSMVEDFLREVDAAWRWPAPRKIRLRVMGSAALLLQSDYRRGTKDSDVYETIDLSEETKEHLRELAGLGSPLHKRRKLYLDIVGNGLPFLPQLPLWHPLMALNASLSHLELEVLDIVDVVVSKLKRYSRVDADDVSVMVKKGLVPHARLVERFRSAVDVFSYDARAEELPRYVRNLHRVERDGYGAEGTDIELPGWI